MKTKSIILFVALSILSVMAWTNLSVENSTLPPLKDYNNKISKIINYKTIRQGGSSNYSSQKSYSSSNSHSSSSNSYSSGSYSSSRSYSGGSYSYGK